MLKLYVSGRYIDPLHLRRQDLDIRDIAHNLSMLCRYTGAFPFHYSVAQHSLLVTEMMAKDAHTQNAQLAGLLHDAAEYVFGDVNYHLKKLPELAEYNRLEHQTSEMIVAHYGSDPGWLDTVKHYDRRAAELEMAVRDGKNFSLSPLSHFQVYHQFLDKFNELTGTVPYRPERFIP